MQTLIRGRTYRSLGGLDERLREIEEDTDLSNGLTERELSALKDEYREIKDARDEFLRADLLRAASNPVNRESGASFDYHRTRHGDSTGLDDGLRAIDRHRNELTPEAADRLDALIRKADPTGIGNRYLAAVADPNYNSAFGKIVMDPTHGHLRFSPEEVAAVQRVSAVESVRALSLTGSAGGFAVPFALDPSIMLSSSGGLNVMRELASVETIAVDEWRGISSAGVVASYQPAATEATDDAPTFSQPTISTEKAQAFVPFSIEIGMDWNGLQAEMGKLLADAKDVLEATKFVLGSGTNEPQGVLTGLTTTQRVLTAGTASFAVGDPWSLKAALPVRFVPGAEFVANPAIFDTIYRFVGGNSTEPVQMPTRDGALLGKPAHESSAMVSTTTTGSKILLYGDVKAAYKIVDRIGLSIELIPHLVGANRRPTGQRGAYAWWRNSGGVVNANALRYLEVR